MQYRMLQLLASGGFSEVFEVSDPGSALDEILVLKRLHPEMSARPAVRDAFRLEAQTLRSLSHPDVVSFRRCFYDEEGRVCLLMERVDGQVLGDWSRDHADDVRGHLQLFDLVLGAVDYLHHRPRPLLHLDLKPDNVLVRDTPLGPRPTLIDFGIARGAGEAGLKAFTEPFSAPEQRRGGALNCATDVHALGHVLAVLLERISDHLEPARVEALRSVVERATASRPRQRFADAAEMRGAFREARAVGTEVGDRRSAPVIRPVLLQLATVTVALTLLVAGILALGTDVLRPVGPSSASTEIPADVIGDFHDELQRALGSTNHAATERHFARARRLLNHPEIPPQARQDLEEALTEVRRIVNRPIVSRADREQARRWLSEQISSVSRTEVNP